MITPGQAARLLDQPPPAVPPGQLAIGDQPEPTPDGLAAANARGLLFDLESL